MIPKQRLTTINRPWVYSVILFFILTFVMSGCSSSETVKEESTEASPVEVVETTNSAQAGDSSAGEEKIISKPAVIVAGVVNLRTQPEKESPALGQLVIGDPLTVQASVQNEAGETWYRVTHASQEAFVRSDLINLLEELSTIKWSNEQFIAFAKEADKRIHIIEYRDFPDYLRDAKMVPKKFRTRESVEQHMGHHWKDSIVQAYWQDVQQNPDGSGYGRGGVISILDVPNNELKVKHLNDQEVQITWEYYWYDTERETMERRLLLTDKGWRVTGVVQFQ
ncbi:SH3 domain-containing protein [Heliorestis acidaminivorans]|uniref:SH3 domain-containing protein n=1 Tax=Heliorestis acidaminivorans TaxID=553427 RepID=A0A6I0ERC3_9FIRM|nr:SH3 domain-containing protein [Heliorestis acidaminivorans]KAB2952909.1 SH3 domain-containing protein [Heliorestis acidaminivorans]